MGKDTTTLIDAKGSEEKISARIEEIKHQIDDTVSPYEKETLQDRLAKFIGGVAIVHVGGHTEVEMKEKKDRVDDALHATKAALEEGILPGGGIALLNAATMLEERLISIESKDEYKGYQIVLDACEAPFRKILTNAGFTTERINDIDTELQNSKDKWLGFNPRENKTVNMFESGIIDPTKVTRLALENAASVAGTMLITEAVVSITPELSKKEDSIDPNMLLG